MKSKVVEYKNLKFEIPEDTEKPLLIKWMDEKKEKIVDLFEVKPEEEDSFETFMKELFIQPEYEWVSRNVHAMKRNKGEYAYIPIPTRFWDAMGNPRQLLVGLDKVNNELLARIRK